MEWVKITAKTLPEAIDLALDNLGVDESEAEIVVVEEPRQGLFGRMRGTARVEARVKPKPTRPKIERNRNRKSRSEGGSKGKGGNDRNRNRSRNRSGGNKGSGNQGSGNQGSGNRGAENKSAGNKDSGSRDSGTPDSGKRGGDRNERNDRSDGQNRSKGESRNRGGRGGSGGGKGRTNNDQETKPKEETPVEEVAAHLQTFLGGLTEAFGFDDEVTVDSSEEGVLVGRIAGQHGLLVGPKGRTLDAVQELARISCQRTVPSSVRIKVDVGGYRQQRVEALGAFARKAADNAVESSAEVALEPMSAADRKAVHDALSDDDRVETRSVGNDPRRKVLVVPVVEADDYEDEDETPVVDNSNGDSAAEADEPDLIDVEAGEEE